MKSLRHYATLASAETMESTYNSEESFAIKLMSVRRTFLHNYFLSKEAGTAPEEEEMPGLLAKIQNLN